MTAMELHQIIGDLLTAVLLAGAIVAALLYLVLLLSGGFGTRSDDSDVIGSHLVASDGKSWDFSKENHSDKARAQRTVSAYDDKGAKAATKLQSDPEVWDGVEYDDDGRKYEIVPAQGETRPVRSDMDLEIVDAEIIPE